MSQHHDDTAPVESDPTGMRALLASLPDPGPMPADLVARIGAALAAESRRDAGLEARSGDAETEPAGAPPSAVTTATPDAGSTVVPLRRRGPRWRHLAVAAAVVGVIGLGGYAVGSLPGGLTASLESGGSADSAADSAAESDAGRAAEDAATAGGSPVLGPSAGSGEVVLVQSGVDHASDRLDVTARALDDGTLDPVADLGAPSSSLGTVATPAGARSCADALGIPASAGLLVDVAEVDGVPGAVLVVHDVGGRAAWAVERSCTTGNTGLIRGPVPLG